MKLKEFLDAQDLEAQSKLAKLGCCHNGKNIYIDKKKLRELLAAISDVVFHQVDEDYCLMCDETELGEDIVALKKIYNEFIKNIIIESEQN